MWPSIADLFGALADSLEAESTFTNYRPVVREREMICPLSRPLRAGSCGTSRALSSSTPRTRNIDVGCGVAALTVLPRERLNWLEDCSVVLAYCGVRKHCAPRSSTEIRYYHDHPRNCPPRRRIPAEYPDPLGHRDRGPHHRSGATGFGGDGPRRRWTTPLLLTPGRYCTEGRRVPAVSR